MAETSTSAAPSHNSNTGRGRNRGPRKRNKRNKQQGTKKPNVPLPAQTKLVWRNIANVDKYGSVEKILKMVQSIIAIANEKNANHYAIDIDQRAMRYLIQEEERSQKYLKDFAAAAKENDAEEEEEMMEEDLKNPAEKEETKEETKEQLDVVIAPKLNSFLPIITARPLYIIPPRKSRRHGEKVGCAYILLTAPKIEKIELPNVVSKVLDVKPMEEINPERGKEGAPRDKSEAEEKEEKTSEASPETAPTTEAHTEEAQKAKPSVMDTAAINKALAAEYSNAVAKGRLLVSRAIEFLTDMAAEDAKGSQEYAGCQIETAMSGKTWRHQYRADRREGTIESTSEYKNWIQSLTKKEEELNARPKPAPGGGTANNLVGLVEGSSDSAQPVAAIVQHLRARRQEMKRKKNKKKKEKSEKANVNKNSKKKAEAANRGAGAAAGKKKKKKGGKKKGAGGGGGGGGGGVGKKPAAPPTALLKPASGGMAH